MKLAKLLSGRPAAPSGALIRAMKWDVSAISVAVMSGATSSGSRIQESSKSPSKTIARTAEQKRRRELEEGFNNFTDGLLLPPNRSRLWKSFRMWARL
jgi:hypothetical protein